MPKRLPLAAALAAPRTVDSAAAIKPPTPEPRAYKVAPSRAGRVTVSFYTPDSTRRALKITATSHGLTLQELIDEAIADVLRKYGAPASD